MKDFLYTNRLFAVGLLAMFILFGISFIDPNRHSGDSTLIFIIMIFVVLALLSSILSIFIFQKIYLKWIPTRNRELEELSREFGFSFTDLAVAQKLQAFKEYPVNKIEGTISGHQISISDIVKFKIDLLMPYLRQTAIFVDGQKINNLISNSGFGGTIYLTPIKDLQAFLREVGNNNMNHLEINKLKSVKFSYASLIWVLLILIGLALELFLNYNS